MQWVLQAEEGMRFFVDSIHETDFLPMKKFLLVTGLLLGLLTSRSSRAQAPAWQSAIAVASGSTARVMGTAADASGNVYMTGFYTGTAGFGSLQLTSTTFGSLEVFVAKWHPTTGYVWVVRAGGSGSTGGGVSALALALRGSTVYVAGSFNCQTATFGSTVLTNVAAPNTFTSDVFVAKLTDAGSSASFVGAVRAGGAGNDRATALVVQGSSLFVTGDYDGVTASFGSTVLTNAGAAFTTDVYVTRLSDAGSGLAYDWALSAGGTRDDTANGLAVNGSSVYLTGFIERTASFGATTLTGSGASGYIAKLTDAGNSATFGWVQQLTGAGAASGTALAVNGTTLYATGSFVGTVAFGSASLTYAPTTIGGADIYVARLNDAGTSSNFAWALRAGGARTDVGYALAVSGSSVYVAGSFDGTADFGSSSVTTAGATDVFVAKVLDAGSSASFAWAQRAGGTGQLGDVARGLALSGNRLYVVGDVTPPASFGSFTLTNTNGFLASFTDSALPTATAAATALAPLVLSPNPAHGTSTVHLPAGLATPETTITVTDALGRQVYTQRLRSSTGTTAELDLNGLRPGLYHLQLQAAGRQLGCWLAVE